MTEKERQLSASLNDLGGLGFTRKLPPSLPSQKTYAYKENKMLTTELATTTADRVQGEQAFEGFTFNQRMILFQALSQRLRDEQATTEQILNTFDPDAELGEEGETFIELHSEEPLEGILGVILALLLKRP